MNLVFGTATGDGSDTLDQVENIIGSPFSDVLTGRIGVNVILGGDGNDTLAGGSGNDDLQGEGGNDTLSGDVGNDSLTAALVSTRPTTRIRQRP